MPSAGAVAVKARIEQRFWGVLPGFILSAFLCLCPVGRVDHGQ